MTGPYPGPVDVLALPGILDPKNLLAAGLVMLLFIVFAETGLLVGFFLPGDTLLFLAGIYAAGVGDVKLPLWGVLVGVPLAAFFGAQTGYYIGLKAGPPLLRRPKSNLFSPKNVRRAEAYLDQFGEGKAIVAARFIPVVRTFMNPVAGALEIPVRKFTLFNAIGAVVWGAGVPLAGYLAVKIAGEAVEDFPIDKFILPVVGFVVVASVISVVHEIRKARREGREDELIEERAEALRREDSPLD